MKLHKYQEAIINGMAGRLLGARVTRPIFLDDGTWMREGDKCLPRSPLRRGLVIKAHRDEITVRWDDGKEQVLLSHGVDRENASAPNAEVSLLDDNEQIRQDLIRRSRLMFPKLWEAQGRKCAKCGKKVPLSKACKSAYSFEIVCSKCHIGNRKHTIIIIDECVDMPSNAKVIDAPGSAAPDRK